MLDNCNVEAVDRDRVVDRRYRIYPSAGGAPSVRLVDELLDERARTQHTAAR